MSIQDCAIAAGVSTSSTFTSGWTSHDVWRDHVGTWHMRNNSPVAWPRLLNIRLAVTESKQGEKVKGKVRAKRVPKLVPSSRNPKKMQTIHVWVYLLEDSSELAQAPDVGAAFKDAERQMATRGKHRDKYFLSPAKVAEKLGVDISLVPKYRKNGIPWMPRVSVGRNRGKKRKPTTKQFKNGYYGHHDHFWLESEVEEFATVKNALPTDLPAGRITLDDAAESKIISKGYAREKVGNNDFGAEVMFVRRGGKRKDGNEVFFTSSVKALKSDDLHEFHQSHLIDPVPPDKITVGRLAQILRKSVAFVYARINNGAPELGNKKLTSCYGPVLYTIKDANGRARSNLGTGIHLLKSQGKIIFETLYPGEKWPLPDHEIQGGLLNEIKNKVDQSHALHEANSIIAKDTREKTGTIIELADKTQATVVTSGQKVLDAIDGKMQQRENDDSTTVFFHGKDNNGDSSYAQGRNGTPKVVSGEIANILKEFQEKKIAIRTTGLSGIVENVSRVMKRIDKMFPGSVRWPDGRDGYFICVKNA